MSTVDRTPALASNTLAPLLLEELDADAAAAVPEAAASPVVSVPV